MNLVDGAKYQGEPGVAFWCAQQSCFVDPSGKVVPEFVPTSLDEELPMHRYFVHRYDVVRVKVAVKARDQQDALRRADDYLAKQHPLADVYHNVGDPEKIAEHHGFPTWIYCEKNESDVGYLVDEFGDHEHNRSMEYDTGHHRLHPTWGSHPDFPVEDWQYEVANDDTRLGYADWLSSKLTQRFEEAA